MASAATINLSPSDANVFNILFSPDGPTKTLDPKGLDAASLLGFPEEQFKALNQAQKQALKLISDKSPPRASVEDAIHYLKALSSEHPDFAPTYVNLAQLRRLLIGEEIRFSQETVETWEAIITDLFVAIKLATPPSNIPISEFQTHMLAIAHTHIGYVMVRASKVGDDAGTFLPPSLKGMNRARLEEVASYHFSKAAQFGNEAAQTLAVNLNPYAKLCGSIVKEALKQETQRQ
jgi:hypothetical protein